MNQFRTFNAFWIFWIALATLHICISRVISRRICTTAWALCCSSESEYSQCRPQCSFRCSISIQTQGLGVPQSTLVDRGGIHPENFGRAQISLAVRIPVHQQESENQPSNLPSRKIQSRSMETGRVSRIWTLRFSSSLETRQKSSHRIKVWPFNRFKMFFF